MSQRRSMSSLGCDLYAGQGRLLPAPGPLKLVFLIEENRFDAYWKGQVLVSAGKDMELFFMLQHCPRGSS